MIGQFGSARKITAAPHATNAAVVAQLVGLGAAIVSLEPRPRSLAEVYLETIEEAEPWT